jgi:hypothetical protein
MRVSRQCVPWFSACTQRGPGTHDLSVSPCPPPLGGDTVHLNIGVISTESRSSRNGTHWRGL